MIWLYTNYQKTRFKSFQLVWGNLNLSEQMIIQSYTQGLSFGPSSLKHLVGGARCDFLFSSWFFPQKTLGKRRSISLAPGIFQKSPVETSSVISECCKPSTYRWLAGVERWRSGVWSCAIPIPIGSVGRTVYLPTFTIQINQMYRCIYHGSYGIKIQVWPLEFGAIKKHNKQDEMYLCKPFRKTPFQGWSYSKENN